MKKMGANGKVYIGRKKKILPNAVKELKPESGEKKWKRK